MKILIGDCKDVLKSFPDESIDCIVTDPPYGISFMGKEWDKALPSIEALKECCRVLKSGAFGFFVCAPRMDVLWRMGQRLEEAGFRIDFSFISWATAQGFPKAQNMSKAIDKRFGAEREVIGIRKRNGGATKLTASNGWHDGPMKNDDSTVIETAPATEQAKRFDGAYSGFQPKPALECIITVMKPLSEKTFVDQALTNGKGVTWLNDCKIPYETTQDPATNPLYRAQNGYKNKQYCDSGSVNYKLRSEEESERNVDPVGRFPANLLVSDNVLDRGIISKGIGKSYSGYDNKLDNATFNFGNEGKERQRVISDSGDFSRYFSLDAWWSKKIQELPEEQQKTFPFLITPKPSKSEKNKYIENKHPTVKPLKLMSYLITMGSREGDLILDPFAGSGTTLEAARLLNRQFIGIDKDEANKPLMEARGQINEITLESF